MLVTLARIWLKKQNPIKQDATVNYILERDSCIQTKGAIILYFKKESLFPTIGYGSQLIINKPLQEIKNSGNPGGFNYKRYSFVSRHYSPGLFKRR
jgi:competence protein ComEC